MMKTALFSALCAVVLLPASSFGQANLSFSGGSGTPLTLTLAQPVSFVVSVIPDPSFQSPYFVFQGIGNPTQGNVLFLSGTMTYSINGGAPFSFELMFSGGVVGAVNVSDLQVRSSLPLPGLSLGDVVLLTAGTLTTTDNVAEPARASGSFNTFLVNQAGRPLTPDGIAVPEPQPLALAAVGVLALLLIPRARRRIARMR